MNARTLVLSCALAVTATAAAAQASPAPAPMDTAVGNAVRRLLAATGARKNMQVVLDQMIGTYRTNMPQVPSEFWDEMQKQFNPDSLMELEVPIYAKYLSLDELRAVSAFYESPAGKQFVTAQPAILQESMEAGRRWGAEMGRQIVEKLKARGYTKSS